MFLSQFQFRLPESHRPRQLKMLFQKPDADPRRSSRELPVDRHVRSEMLLQSQQGRRTIRDFLLASQVRREFSKPPASAEVLEAIRPPELLSGEYSLR